MSVGALLAFQTLMAQFNRPFGDLVALGSQAQALQAELTRLDDVLHCECDPVFHTLTPSHDNTSRREPPRRLSGQLSLRNVTFGYNRVRDLPLIRDFSLELAPGRRVALVGRREAASRPSAESSPDSINPGKAGCSTTVTISTKSRCAVFTNHVAVVDDQTFLFAGTVRDNLSLWDDALPSAT